MTRLDESACFTLKLREDVQSPGEIRAAILVEHAELRTLMRRLDRNVRRMRARMPLASR